MPGPRLALTAALVVASALALAACGSSDNKSSSTQASASGAAGGELFAQTSDSGTLTPIQGQSGVYDLTLSNAAPDVTQFTDRPVRKASTESLADFVASWDQRGFGQDPPNAALVLDQQPPASDTSVYELADPRLDKASGDVTYRATHVEGGTTALPQPDRNAATPAKFSQAHLFIDPGSTPTVDFFVQANSSNGRMELTLDSPFTVFVGAGQQEAVFAGGPGGGFVGGNAVSITGNGSIDVQVAGGNPPITGTARLPSGARVTAQVNSGATRPIQNGSFSVGP